MNEPESSLSFERVGLFRRDPAVICQRALCFELIPVLARLLDLTRRKNAKSTVAQAPGDEETT